MRKLILDSSICFDLYNTSLLDLVLKLPYAFFIPDVILEEELIEPDADEFIARGFSKCILSSKEVEVVSQLAIKYTKPSRNDIFALTCAKTKDLILLTGDGDLRKSAEEEKIEVHGLIWVLDELIRHNLIKPKEAANSLRIAIAQGSRLPKIECEERFKLWEGK